MRQKLDAKTKWHVFLRVICAALLISIGFAHRPVQASNTVSPDYYAEQYRLPDGSFAEICLGQHNDGQSEKHPHSALFNICDACILTSSLLLPVQDPTELIRHEAASPADAWLQHSPRVTRDISQRYLARAPPYYL